MTARESRDARQDRAILLLLQALPEDRLDRVLEQLGIEPEKREQAHLAKRDPRRCKECGHGYFLCRELDAKSPDEHHAWTPDKTRAGVPL